MKGEEEQARAERLAAALRANLSRRKQQARGRREPPAPAHPAPDERPDASPEPDGEA
ncbi:hypothetical protein [Ancylobacter sp. IITR112]|uniref:hypothetical protein n=1 Tax=Ancylobacter sp. IITR112 TaxID=3138073 RepID=UPI00352BA027